MTIYSVSIKVCARRHVSLYCYKFKKLRLPLDLNREHLPYNHLDIPSVVFANHGMQLQQSLETKNIDNMIAEKTHAFPTW